MLMSASVGWLQQRWADHTLAATSRDGVTPALAAERFSPEPPGAQLDMTLAATPRSLAATHPREPGHQRMLRLQALVCS